MFSYKSLWYQHISMLLLSRKLLAVFCFLYKRSFLFTKCNENLHVCKSISQLTPCACFTWLDIVLKLIITILIKLDGWYSNYLVYQVPSFVSKNAVRNYYTKVCLKRLQRYGVFTCVYIPYIKVYQVLKCNRCWYRNLIQIMIK